MLNLEYFYWQARLIYSSSDITMDRRKKFSTVLPRARRKEECVEDDEKGSQDDDVGKFCCSQCDRKFDTLAARVEHFSKDHLRHSAVRLQKFSSLKREGESALNDRSEDPAAVSPVTETVRSRYVFLVGIANEKYNDYSVPKVWSYAYVRLFLLLLEIRR